jgi:putative glycosyltransferase (TIGR04348 family)
MGAAVKPVVCIVTPGTQSANNGNWRTAVRWADMLRDRYRVIVQTAWDGKRGDAVIALHARRSAESIEAFAAHSPGRLGVVLTGTDLYRDTTRSAIVARSLDLARRIVTLQDDALRLLAPRWRRKADVIFQSARPLRPRRKAPDRLDCVVVGHLRDEKDPRTLFRAVARLPRELPIRFRHVGAPLDPDLGRAAKALQREDPRYRYTGPLPHGLARAAIQSAHLLVHPSIAEGGANVVVEAITSGTPVLASEISGNVGMLGRDYPGYFPVGDDAALAARLARALGEPGYLATLRDGCAKRRPLFAPVRETHAVRSLAAALLA